MITNYKEAMEWLYNQPRGKNRKNLDDIKVILKELGNPHLSAKIIHVAGTNGKGSTISFLQNILMAHHKKVAVFTSPHIMKFNERFQINHKNISDDKLVKLVNRLTCYKLSQFEYFTLIFFLYISQENIDYALIEVGIGGLLDTTNVVEPYITLITSVGMDHMDLLGNSLENIAKQKAGIIKQNIPILVGQVDTSVAEIIKNISDSKQAPLIFIDEDLKNAKEKYFQSYTEFMFENNLYKIELLGIHQINNAILALKCCQLVLKEEWCSHLVKEALYRTKWIGRFEKISEKPIIYLDGAHNIDGIKSLVQSIKQLFPTQKINIIFSALKRKSYDEMLLLLAPFHLKITSFDFIGSIEQKDLSISFQKLFIEDWKKELNCAKENEIYIVTGSLYFIAQVREFLMKKRI